MPDRTLNPGLQRYFGLAGFKYLAVAFVSPHSIHWPRQCGYAVVALQSISLLQITHRGGCSEFTPIYHQCSMHQAAVNTPGAPFSMACSVANPHRLHSFWPAYKIGISWQDSIPALVDIADSNRVLWNFLTTMQPEAASILFRHKKFLTFGESTFQPFHPLCAILYRTQSFFKKEFRFVHHSLRLYNKPKSTPAFQYCKMVRKIHPSPQTPPDYHLSKGSNCNIPIQAA